jgi:putative nucleotidyltransferase with HDIG domain
MWLRIRNLLEEVNKELWLLLGMFSILAALNYLVAADRMLLGLYVLPTVYSAYSYGRRHATLTALGSVLLVILVVHWNPLLLAGQGPPRIIAERWWDIMLWAGSLIVTAYAMGTLYERKEARLNELRDTYHGVLVVLQQFIARDDFTGPHSIRVAAYATRIAESLGFDAERIEDVRAASLLHDIGKIEISRELLRKAARLTETEFMEVRKHVEKGIHMIEPVGGSLRRIIPIVLAHHDKFDGSGYHPSQGEQIPLEARVISVADAYDSMISDRPYRKAMSTVDAAEAIRKGAGTYFDPRVVEGFLKAYHRGELEIDFTALDMVRS